MVRVSKSMDPGKDQIAREMIEVRAFTLKLFDLASVAALTSSPGFGLRPILWHLAHIGVFEGYWLLQKLRGESPLDERYERVFDPIRTPREDAKDLPPREEMEEYLSRVRAKSLQYLAECDFGSSDPLLARGYIFQLVLEHERQHQETLLYLLQMLPVETKVRPAAVGTQSGMVRRSGGQKMVEIPSGAFVMGAVWDQFAYDNEFPSRTVNVDGFKLARFLTTNDEYREFVEQRGYERREFWSEDGWDYRCREEWEHPLYWSREGGEWSERLMFENGPLRPNHPVVGVSWFEAEAYARFHGKRLPTEAEWEKAASAPGATKHRFAWGDEEPPDRANFGSVFWDTTPVGTFPGGASQHGCLDMTGNVWEWTSDPFDGFPGFKAFPYPEYSDTWFDGDHRILKGGSWATSASVLRTSFRNFFRRNFRIAFAGIRLAE